MGLQEILVSQVAKRLIPLVSNLSDENVERGLKIIEKLAPNESSKSIALLMKNKWEERHPLAIMLRGALQRADPNCVSKLVTNLLVRYHWYGSKRREEIRTKEGIEVPGTFIFSPTMRCNLRCVGCYAYEYDRNQDLGFELIDRIVSEAEDLGIYWLNLVGGEPFICDEMWEIYRRHNDVIFQVFTNGTLIDKKNAKRIAKLGNILPMLSIEGFEKETDARRGKGVFQKVMEGMDNLREEGVFFGCSSMLTRHNVETVISDEFVDLLIEKGCFMGWHFLYIPVGRDPDLSLMPTPEQRNLMRTRGAPYIRSHKPIFLIDFWNDSPYVGGCIAGGSNYFHINSNGDVEPCVFIHFAVDNIKEKSLKEVLKSPYFRGIRARQPYSKNLLRPCTIIDHPQMLREICEEFHPYPTCEGAESIISSPSICKGLDEYSEETAKLLEPAWEEWCKEGERDINWGRKKIV